MRSLLAALIIAAAATFAGPGTNRADAQVITAYGAPISDSGMSSQPSIVPYEGATMNTEVRTFPYSYYTAFPARAREYVPYGPNDSFPFYGNPYGKPYDRWTWDSMSLGSNAMQRYYYPPLR